MKYITKRNVAIAVIITLSIGSLILSYLSYTAQLTNRKAIIEIAGVLGQSGVVIKGQNGEVIVNRIVTVKDLENQGQ